MNWLALDIGGANIKVADGRGFAEVHSFALWKQPDRLLKPLGRLFNRAQEFFVRGVLQSRMRPGPRQITRNMHKTRLSLRFARIKPATHSMKRTKRTQGAPVIAEKKNGGFTNHEDAESHESPGI